jgi:hypothetical protein
MFTVSMQFPYVAPPPWEKSNIRSERHPLFGEDCAASPSDFPGGSKFLGPWEKYTLPKKGNDFANKTVLLTLGE